MIGTVISSTDSICEVELDPLYEPKVGDWFSINGNFAQLESYSYNRKRELRAIVPFFSASLFASAPIPPGTQVNPLSEGFCRKENGIPVGFYMSTKNRFPMYLDLDYVTGPHAAHMNASGLSGAATKTSFLMSTLWAISKLVLESCRIIVNNKQQDLMNIHQSSKVPVDQEYYDLIGLKSEPFTNVKYYASYGSPSLKRKDVKPFGFSIETGFASLGTVFCNLKDDSRTIVSLCERLIRDKDAFPAEFGDYKNWEAIWTEAPLAEDLTNPNSYSYFGKQTVQRFVREAQLILKNQNTGVFLDRERGDVLTLKEIIDDVKAGDTIVLDFSFMSETEQFFCMTELVKAVYGNINSKDRTLPKKVCLFMDELNKYGQAGADAHPIRDLLIEITERGRSIGVSLFSAQQMNSHVHKRILGNNATRVSGRAATEEVGKDCYRYLGNQRESLLRLKKGEMLIYHTPIGNPVRIRFPEPCFMLGNNT